MNLRRLLSLPLLLCLLALVPASVASAQERRPNIIFILADDLGYGDLGCYGQTKIQTPHIDRLAAEGMRFTQFYAGSTVCAPSRCVLMTGLNTGHCYIRGNAKANLRPTDVTVAEALKTVGYTNALCGKWGLGHEGSTGVPTKKGFDHFFGYLDQTHAHNYYPEFLVRNEERVPLRNEVVKEGKPYEAVGAGWASKKVDYSHDLIADEALKFVDQNNDRPFFLYFAVTTPHANNEGTRGTGNGNEVPDYGSYAGTDWTPQNKGFAAMVSRMDADVGRLMQKLKDHGLDRHTLVIFTSDNGPHREGGGDNPEFFDSNGPLRGIKRDMTDGGIRVPFIARWPGKIKPGSTSDHVGYFGDFFATACELTGAKAPEGLDSLSFLPTLLGQSDRQRQHEFLYWEFHENGSKQAVRYGNYKAIKKSPSAPIELYDIAKDITESTNIASENSDVVKRIEEYLRTARTESEQWPLKEPPATPRRQNQRR